MIVQIRLVPCLYTLKVNRIGVVIVSVLTSSAVDRGFKPRSGLTKDYNIGERAKTGRLGIRIMCLSGATCLSADCCISELKL